MKLKKYAFYLVAWLAICGSLAWVGAHFFELDYWLCFLITAAALVLNGIVAEVEDRMPGGFLNPRKKY